MKTLTWSLVASNAQMLPWSTKYGCTVRLMVSWTSGSAACASSRTCWHIACCQSGSRSMYSSTRESARTAVSLVGGCGFPAAMGLAFAFQGLHHLACRCKRARVGPAVKRAPTAVEPPPVSTDHVDREALTVPERGSGQVEARDRRPRDQVLPDYVAHDDVVGCDADARAPRLDRQPDHRAAKEDRPG